MFCKHVTGITCFDLLPMRVKREVAIMVSIHRGRMIGKRRVERALVMERADRVPIDYLANPTIHTKLAARLGVSAEGDCVSDALGVDFKEFAPRYVGPPLFSQRENRRVAPLLGSVARWVPNNSGGYWDYCDFPLVDTDDERLSAGPSLTPTTSITTSCLPPARPSGKRRCAL